MKKLPFPLMAAGVIVALSLLAPAAAFSGKKKPDAAPSEGNALFDKNCKMCHNADKADAKVGPGLKGVGGTPRLARSSMMSGEYCADSLRDTRNSISCYWQQTDQLVGPGL
jgi:cytochrome c2